MMKPEKFKEELFSLLAGAMNVSPDGLFSVSKNMFSSPGTLADLRVYMDSEMQKLTSVRPYFFRYIICRSTAEELVFLDVAPMVKEYSNGIDIIYRYYDCDTNSVKEILAPRIM